MAFGSRIGFMIYTYRTSRRLQLTRSEAFAAAWSARTGRALLDYTKLSAPAPNIHIGGPVLVPENPDA